MRTTSTQGAEDPNRSSVLIVEDESELADLYATWLASTVDVQTAYSGEEALSQIDGTIDVVLLDRRMPGMSGDAVLEVIREAEIGCRVVMISAVTPDFDLIGTSVDDYLTKPVEKDELLHTVERMRKLDSYDEKIQRLHQLLAVQTALASEKSSAELHASEEYSALQDRIEELLDRAPPDIEGIVRDDPQDLFQDFDSNSRDPADREEDNP